MIIKVFDKIIKNIDMYNKIKEIGIGFLLASIIMFFLGIIFFFDRALIIMGNVSFFFNFIYLNYPYLK